MNGNRIPRVAVIVPCHDDGGTIDETLASAGREQIEAEIVVVDDGSTDPATLTILARLEDEGLSVIHQENRGPSAACMAGLAATSAPYVMRLDADDLLEPGTLGALADALDVNPDAAAAWGDIQTFGRTTFRIPGAPGIDPWLLTYVNCVPGAGSLLRRSALIEAGGWQLQEGFEDWDLWLTLGERGGRGISMSRVTFQYRRDEHGRLARSLSDSARHYETLRSRHEALWAERKGLRRRSPAPRAVKLALPIVDRLPWVSRLAKIQLCELATRLFWIGGIRATAPMARQAAALRLGRGRRHA